MIAISMLSIRFCTRGESCFKAQRVKLSHFLYSRFVFSFLIRLYIEGYLEFAVASFVNLKYL